MRQTKEQERVAQQVESVLAESFPEVELTDVALRGGRQPGVTLYIDRAQGVDLELCAAVAKALDDLREQYSVEVSSPGLDRTLTRPAHFARAVGSVITLRTEAPLAGRSNFRGLLTGASELDIQLAVEDGEPLSLSYDQIARARVVPQFTGSAQSTNAQSTGIGGRHE
jgi:ribosome maturation factor RimP